MLNVIVLIAGVAISPLLTPGVNQYTGTAEGGEADDCDLLVPAAEEGPIRDGEELPEERFHRADIISQHMVDTREKQRKEKVQELFSQSVVWFVAVRHLDTHDWLSSVCRAKRRGPFKNNVFLEPSAGRELHQCVHWLLGISVPGTPSVADF